MKIIGLKEFLAMPAGTVFQKYTPVVCDDLCVKQDSLLHINDFTFDNLECVDAIDAEGTEDMLDKLDAAENKGVELALDFDQIGRDGIFDDKQLFAVWSKQDVEKLIDKLQRSIGLTNS